jgi:sulfate permease
MVSERKKMSVVILIFICLFLAVNMGVSGFSVSFTPSYGSGILNKNKTVIIYTLSVILGGVLIGPRVVETLVNKITFIKFNVISGGIILASSALTIFLSNIVKVPQSSSLVTVASFVGAGLYYGKVNWYTIYKIIIFATIFSLLSLAITILIKRKVYPPRQDNIKFYENFFVHRKKLRKFIIFHDVYAGFGIGTNNVANVVAPLIMSLKVSPFLGFLIVSLFFGLGAHILGGRVIHSLSKEIVPVGEFSASIVSFITATFVIIASLLGLPTPYVQFTTFSLIGISCIKDGLRCTMNKSMVRRIIWVWFLVPLFTVIFSFALHILLLKR